MRRVVILFAVMAGCSTQFCAEVSADRENPSGADFDGDELHDGVQFPGGDMPDRLHRAGRCAGRRRTTTGNANSSASCQLSCSTVQITCQTTCAQISPSQ